MHQRHLATISLFAYNFLMDSQILTFFGMKINIDNKNNQNFTKSSKIWALDSEWAWHPGEKSYHASQPQGIQHFLY